MFNLIKILIFFCILNSILLVQSCKEGTNNCSQCDPVTNLCSKCSLQIYYPNDEGGCSPSGKCFVGKNYCSECDENEKECSKCDMGLYPDKNGGCSFIVNCEISYKGMCLKCREDYILVGGEDDAFKVCKSLNSEDFLNCQIINNSSGLCEECRDGYFLNIGDFRCSQTENCYDNIYGKCNSCKSGFYLNMKEDKCLPQSGALLFCKISLNGETCDTCDEDYFFDENYNCVGINYCADGQGYECKKCIEEYFLTQDQNACTKEQNCYTGNRKHGICNSCVGNNYIDLDSRKCKSNQEDDDFKYCKTVENKECLSCDLDYNLSGDGKCTKAINCAEVENGECIFFSDEYFLTRNGRCTTTEHCIFMQYFECNECEEGYYYDKYEKKCFEEKEGYENCKYTSMNGEYCFWCKNGFYNNQVDHLCYSNEEKNEFYKCSLLDTTGSFCVACEDGYFNGFKDYKCSKIQGCSISENEDKCLECRDRYCLNVKTQVCVSNQEIKEEERYYYKCNKTNEEGDKCEVCVDGYMLNEEGFCFGNDE